MIMTAPGVAPHEQHIADIWRAHQRAPERAAFVLHTAARALFELGGTVFLRDARDYARCYEIQRDYTIAAELAVVLAETRVYGPI